MDSTNSNTTRNWVIGIVVIIVLILIVVAVGKNGSTVVDNYDFGNATSTGATSTNNGGNGTSNGNGSSNSGNTNGGTVAGNSIINNDAMLKSLINNLGVRIPETGMDIALANGVGNATVNNQKYTLTAGPILGKIKTDDGYDVFVDMTLVKTSAGTTGTAKVKYLATYHVLNEVVLFKSAVIVGTNIEVRSITASADKSISVNTNQNMMSSTKGYILTVTYLDRKNGEPVTTAPTVSKTIVFNVKNHMATR
jgi:hypothetical protein